MIIQFKFLIEKKSKIVFSDLSQSRNAKTLKTNKEIITFVSFRKDCISPKPSQHEESSGQFFGRSSGTWFFTSLPKRRKRFE
jgi:hypothetical protein